MSDLFNIVFVNEKIPIIPNTTNNIKTEDTIQTTAEIRQECEKQPAGKT